MEYVRDGAEIYRRSFATIRAEADLSGLPADVARVAVRMIHACGMVDLVADIGFSTGVVTAARKALLDGAPILCDAQMVASGVTRKRLPADNPVICTLRDPAVPALAAQLGTTRSAAAMDLWLDHLAGAGRGRGGGAGHGPPGGGPGARVEPRRCAPAGRGDRHPGRFHRRRRVQGRPGRVRSGASGGTWTPRR